MRPAQSKGAIATSVSASDTEALADGEPRDARPDGIDSAHDFVPRNDGHGLIGERTVDHVQVGAAHAARQNVDADFARPGRPVPPSRGRFRYRAADRPGS